MVRKARNTRLLRTVIEDSALLTVHGRINIGHLKIPGGRLTKFPTEAL